MTRYKIGMNTKDGKLLEISIVGETLTEALETFVEAFHEAKDSEDTCQMWINDYYEEK